MQPSDLWPRLPQKHIDEHTTIETQIMSEGVIPHLQRPIITNRPNVPHKTATKDLPQPTSSAHTVAATQKAAAAAANAANAAHILNSLRGGRRGSVHLNQRLTGGTGRYCPQHTFPKCIAQSFIYKQSMKCFCQTMSPWTKQKTALHRTQRTASSIQKSRLTRQPHKPKEQNHRRS